MINELLSYIRKFYFLLHLKHDDFSSSFLCLHNYISTFFRLGNGVCPKSFGINVARLAGLPKEVIEIAKTKSIEFELEMERSLSSRIRSAVASGNAAVIENIWNSLQQQ